MTSYFIFVLFCAFLCPNRKENKKSIYFQREMAFEKQVDDDFIFVRLLCCCLFKFNAESRQKVVSLGCTLKLAIWNRSKVEARVATILATISNIFLVRISSGGWFWQRTLRRSLQSNSSRSGINCCSNPLLSRQGPVFYDFEASGPSSNLKNLGLAAAAASGTQIGLMEINLQIF